MVEQSDTGSVARLSTSRWQLLLVAAGVLAGFFYSQFHLSHDNSWYLIATRRFLNGARLYVDIIELNPPLAFYLTVPGLAFADWAGLSDKAGYVSYVSALATLANLWTASIVHRARLEVHGKWLLWGAAPLITLLLPISEFGQREHLLIILTLPYFYVAMLRERLQLSRQEEALIGVAAVLGFALKPYFYLAALAVTLMACTRARSLRPILATSNVVIGSLSLAYLAAILIVHPEYLRDIVPLASAVYHSYGIPVWRRIAQPALLAIPAFLFLYRASGPEERVIGLYAFAIAVGFLTSFFVQFKGWNYHIIPASAYLFLAVAWLISQNLVYLRRSLAVSTLCMVAIIGTLGQQIIRGPYQPWTVGALEPFVPRHNMRILLVTSNVSAAFPFVNEVEGQWSSRYPAQWLIPGAIVALSETDCRTTPEQCERLQAILDRARNDLVSDIARYAPEIIYVDERKVKSHFGGTSFDYMEFMAQDARFEELWTNYRPAGKTFGYRVWYLREGL